MTQGSGRALPVCYWLQYADHEMAPLRRSRRGSITPVRDWLLYADHRMAPICRSVTPAEAEHGYWGQTPISLRRLAPHPAGEPMARRIWALTPKTTTNAARLLFAYFLLAKQEKVSRPPGRDPACRALSGAQPDIQRLPWQNPVCPCKTRQCQIQHKASASRQRFL